MNRQRMPEGRKDLPSGSEVLVTLDDGAAWRTKTRSEPWMLAGGVWVVLLDGKTGGYDLSRVAPVEGETL